MSSFVDPELRKHLAFAELEDLHRMFLRLVVARRCVPEEEAAALLQHVLTSFAPCTGKRPREQLTLQRVVADLAAALAPLKMKMAFVDAEGDGRR